MIEPSEALSRIVSGLRKTGPETVSLTEAEGRICAAPVSARLSAPPADVSAMDGYAVRAADAREGAVLRITEEAPAGHPASGTVTPGTCIRIFTGSLIPGGADAVLIQENADRDGDQLTVRTAPEAGRFIRRQGQDFAEDAMLIPEGRRLSARDIGLAAAAGHSWLTVRRKPRVAILSTGDEIVLPGDAVPQGSIIGSAAFMLAALIRKAGGDPVILPVARDRREDLRAATAAGGATDLFLTIGGASVGDYDLVREALGEAGLVMDFWKIAMRPGRPLMSGQLHGVPMIGLPGNPVAAFVCSLVFVLPALRVMTGDTSAPRHHATARVTCDVAANDRRTDYLRATLSRDDSGQLCVTPFPVQDSAMLTPLAAADALLIRPAHAPAAVAGEVCEVLLFGSGDD